MATVVRNMPTTNNVVSAFILLSSLD
jgi:hypothetical protein